MRFAIVATHIVPIDDVANRTVIAASVGRAAPFTRHVREAWQRAFACVALLMSLALPAWATDVPYLSGRVVDDAVRQLVDDMLATMYEAEGVGLAATQVDVHERIIVMDTSGERKSPLVLINPEIIFKEGSQTGEEGCLSIPGFREDVTRAQKANKCSA